MKQIEEEQKSTEIGMNNPVNEDSIVSKAFIKTNIYQHGMTV